MYHICTKIFQLGTTPFFRKESGKVSERNYYSKRGKKVLCINRFQLENMWILRKAAA